MKLLDLSKFEKVSEDKHTTTMRHKDGHEMTILVAKLPKIHREQLKRLKMAKGGMAHYDDGTPDAPVSSDDSQDQGAAQPATNITINAAQPQAPAQPVQVAAPTNPTLDQLAAQGSPMAPVDQNLGNPTNAALTAGQGVQLGQQAGNLEQQINSAKAQGTIPIAQQQSENAKALAQRLDQTRMDMDQQTKNFADYNSKNPVNPMAFYQNMSVPGKISTALGLLFGGFTAGFSGTGNNPAMNWLQDQQNKDIQAQKDRLGQQKTVWEAYQNMYHNNNASDLLTAKSWNDQLSAQANELSAKLGTPQAQAANMALQSKLLLDNNEKLQKAAFFANQPRGGGLGGSSPVSDVVNQSQAAPVRGGASGSWGPTSSSDDHILAPNAASKLDALSRQATADPAAAAQLPMAQQQYQSAIQADKSIDQINNLWPALGKESTLGGYLANKVDPNAVAGLAASGAEALGAAGAIPTAGASLVGAIPGAIAAGGAGRVIGSGIKQGLRAVGGQQETQFETDKATLRGFIGNALAGTNTTPTAMDGLAEEFTPSYVDSKEQLENKRKRLIEKIQTLTKTSALDDHGMTRKR